MEFENLMKISLTNEKGNVKATERKKQKTGAINGLIRMTEEYAANRVITKDGIAVAMGQDPLTGNIVWAHFSIVINEKEPEVMADNSKLFEVKS